jgi:hypothetical protein
MSRVSLRCWNAPGRLYRFLIAPEFKARPYRVLYAFDPRRTALLLLGGDKTGDERWYERMIPKADALYESHLRELTKK